MAIKENDANCYRGTIIRRNELSMVYRLRFEDADMKNVSTIGRFITKKGIIAYVNICG